MPERLPRVFCIEGISGFGDFGFRVQGLRVGFQGFRFMKKHQDLGPPALQVYESELGS